MKEKRMHRIKEYIDSHGTATLDELSKKFGVSLTTIRRDLDILAKEGDIKKVYGGVKSKDNHPAITLGTATAFDIRSEENSPSKEAIGKLAAPFICNNDVIFIDSGTTTNRIIKNIDPDIEFTLITNSLDVIIAAVNMPNINLTVLGSLFYRQTRSFITTPFDEIEKFDYNVSKAFMAVTGATIKSGLTNSDFHELKIKQSIVSNANEVFLIADTTKFNTSTLMTYAPLEAVNTIVTNDKLSDEIHQFCDEHDIRIVY